jgi:hypothetical protein
MKNSNPHSRAPRSSASQRAQLLTAFDRSGLSAAAFARKHQLNYTTFCGWRQRRNQTAVTVPGFVQVELPAAAAANVLIVELVGGARLRIESPDQIVLAAALVHQLHTSRPC